MIAVSTTWNYSENCNLRQMLAEISGLGIKSIEIGYNFTARRLNELKAILPDFGINVVSVHNFCPLPPQNQFRRFFTNYYYLSSPDETERKNAVLYTKETIDTAARIGAKIIVIHAGTIEIDSKYIKQLINLYNQGKILTEDAQRFREDFLHIRTAKKGPYIDAVLKSLSELVRYAKNMNIKIGLENRYYPNEIPNIDEAALFLKEFNDNGLVYWHDAGHAIAQEHLGTIEKNSLLGNFGNYLFGFHLHGINGLHDHLAPIAGDFDFLQISTHLARQDLLKVIEAHQPTTSSELIETMQYFGQRGWL
jgi:sugar phosphate isomerase/epimerase